MLLEGSDCGGNGLSIVGAVSGGIGEELSGEAGLFRMFGTKIGMLLVSCGLELVQSLSEHCLHLGHVGLVDLLKSLEASEKIISVEGSSGRCRCTCWWDAGRIAGGGASGSTGRGGSSGVGWSWQRCRTSRTSSGRSWRWWCDRLGLDIDAQIGYIEADAVAL